MRNFETQRGFTLVELSISIIIIGILVAGALSAQSIVEDSKIVATVSQVQSYTNAVGLFRKVYAATPGDMYRAGVRLPGCPGTNGAACNPIETPFVPGYPWYDLTNNPTSTTEDDKVGDPNWNVAWGAPATTSTGGLTGAVGVDDERYLFWAHLLMANLIGGVKTDGLNAAIPLQLSITNPALSTGGGLVVGYGLPAVSPAITPKGPGSNQTTAGLSGMLMVHVLDPTLALQTTTGKLPLTPGRAAQIDRKMDDGLPTTGYVQSYGVTATCFCLLAKCGSNGTLAVYDETTNKKDCGLIYRIAD